MESGSNFERDTRISEWVNLVNLNPKGPAIIIGAPPKGTIEGLGRFFDRIVLIRGSGAEKCELMDPPQSQIETRLVTNSGRLPLSDYEASVLAIFPSFVSNLELTQELIRSVHPLGDLVVFPNRGEKTPVNGLKQIRACYTYAFLPNRNDPRWIVPLVPWAVASAALNLYQPSLSRAKIKKVLYRVLSRIGLAGFLNSHQFYHFPTRSEGGNFNLRENIKHILGEEDIFFSLFTGTPPVRRKVTIQVMNSKGKMLGFVRISPDPEVYQLFENEMLCLEALNSWSIKTFLTPRVLHSGQLGKAKFLFQSVPSGRLAPGPGILGENHIESLSELFRLSANRMKVSESRALADMESRLSLFKGKLPFEIHELLDDGLHWIQEKAGEKNFLLGLSHGDFTAWNTRNLKGEIYIFDWEWARWDAPPFQDLYHFEIFRRIFVDHHSAERIWERLNGNNFRSLIARYSQAAGLKKELESISLVWTLVDDISFYLRDFVTEAIALPVQHPFIDTEIELLDKALGEFS